MPTTVASRLPGQAWPLRRALLTAVDAETGDVLSPFGGRSLTPPAWGLQLAAQFDELRAQGSEVVTIVPESGSEHLFGANAMDLSLRPAAARAGYAQGVAVADRLTEFWR